ncbi:MAG: hypothetical protein ACFFCQ_17885 [Promethearchaeota archaeon]
MTDEIQGITYIRMDPKIGPITEFSWKLDKDQVLEGMTNTKSVVQLFTVAMLDETPRSMEFSDSKVLFSGDHESGSLLAVYLSRKVNTSNQQKLWRRMRVIHGKSKGETQKLLDSLEKIVNPVSC